MFLIEKMSRDGDWLFFKSFLNETAAEVAYEKLRTGEPAWHIRLMQIITKRQRIPANVKETGIADVKDSK